MSTKQAEVGAERASRVEVGGFQPAPFTETTVGDGSEMRAAGAAKGNTAPDPVYAPRPLTRAQMVALVGEDGVARAEATEGVRILEDGTRVPAGAAGPAPDVDPVAVLATSADVGPARRGRPVKRQPVPEPESAPVPEAVAAPVEAPPEKPEVRVGTARPEDAPQGPHVVAAPPRMPAASESDTPSRGLLADPGLPQTRSGLPIQGGFGDAGDQYFACTGAELRTVVESLTAALNARLKDDLRFTIANVFPNVRVRLDLTVEGYLVPNVEVAVPWVQAAQTPVDVARARAAEVVFVTTETVSEAEGETPNGLRQALGLPVPRKQRVNGSLADLREIR